MADKPKAPPPAYPQTDEVVVSVGLLLEWLHGPKR